MLANIDKVLAAGREVYYSYLALEFANSYQEADEKTGSLTAQVNRAIAEQKSSPFEIYLANETIRCELEVEQGAGQHPAYRLHFQVKTQVPALEAIRNLKDYTHSEIQSVLCSQQLILRYDPAQEEYVMAIRLTGFDNAAGEIGGPNKYELYSEHIPSLGKLLQRLAAAKQDPIQVATLVAMPMGSGKSFVQALWLLVLHRAKIGGIFAAPGALVPQLHSDMLRILPDDVACDILRVTDDPLEQIAFQEMVVANLQKCTLAIVDHDFLLNECWHQFESGVLSADQYLLSFDEPHKITTEARVLRLNDLVKNQKFQTMLLTATPTRHCFELSGGKATVATTNKERIEQGFAVASEYRMATAISVAEKTKYLSTWKERWAQYFVDVALGMVDPEQTSPADEMINVMLYEFIAKDPKQGKFYRPAGKSLEDYRNFLRWNITIPCAQKMMVVAPDAETLVNAVHHLEDPATTFLYREGSVRLSHEIPPMEEQQTASEAYRAHRQAQLFQQIGIYSATHGFKARDFQEYVEQKLVPQDLENANGTSVHYCGIIDNALSALTGYDFLTLDSKRFADLSRLWAEIQERLDSWPLQDAATCQMTLCQKFNKEGLPYDIAQQLAERSYEIFCYLSDNNHSVEERISVVDNWYFDATQNRRAVFADTFFQVAPLTLILGENFRYQPYEPRETHLRNQRVYSGFTYRHYPKAKVGQSKGLLEIMNPEATSDIFVPVEYNISSEALKALFRHKLTTHVVTNSLDTGFNDLDLQMVVNLTGFSGDANPEQMVQASGRNRGLSPERPPPAFLQICDRGVKPFLPLSALQDGDFVQPLLEASETFRHETLNLHAERMAKQIVSWIQGAINPDGTIDEPALAKYSLELAQKLLIHINQNQSFNLDNTRREFCRFLKLLENALHQEAHRMTHPTEMSFGRQLCFAILGGIARWVYKWFFQNPAIKKVMHQVQELLKEEDDKVSPEVKAKLQLYQKIISQNHKVAARNQVTIMFSTSMLLKDTQKIIQASDLSVLLTEAGKINVNLKIAAFLGELIGDAPQHQALRETINHCPLLWKIFLNKELMECLVTRDFNMLMMLLETHADPEIVAFKDGVLGPVIAAVMQNVMMHGVGAMPAMPELDIKALASDLDLRLSPQFPDISRMFHSKVLSDALETLLTPYTEKELELLLPQHHAPARTKAVMEFLDDLKHMSHADFDHKHLSSFDKFQEFSSILQDVSQLLSSIENCQSYFHGFDAKLQKVPNESAPELIEGTALAAADCRVQSVETISDMMHGLFFAQTTMDCIPDINSLQAQAKVHHARYTTAVADNWTHEILEGLTRGVGFFAAPSPDALSRHASAISRELLETQALTLQQAQSGQLHCFQDLLTHVDTRIKNP